MEFLGLKLTGKQSAATHVAIHETKENASLGATLRGETTDGQPQEYWPIGEVTPDFIVNNWGEGIYRFSPAKFNETSGKWQRFGTTGAVSVKARPAKPTKRTANGHASTPTNGFDALATYQLLAEQAEKRAERAYTMQAERDRAFMATIVGAVRGPAPPTVDLAQIEAVVAKAVAASRDDDDDDDDDGQQEEAPAWAKPIASSVEALVRVLEKKFLAE